MSRNIEAVEVLEERGRMVKPVFISIDPDRDTPEMLTDFTDILYTREVGIYTLHVATDVVTATAVPVEASMHVTILGGAESQPGWRYAGTGAAFSVAQQVDSARNAGLSHVSSTASLKEMYGALSTIQKSEYCGMG